MPDSITQFLKTNVSLLRHIQRDVSHSSSRPENTAQYYDDDAIEEGLTKGVSGTMEEGLHPRSSIIYEDFWTELERIMDAAGPEWKCIVPFIWAFGPNRIGPNMLIWRCEGRNKTL